MRLKNRRFLAAALSCALAAGGLVAVTSTANADHGNSQSEPVFSSEVIDRQQSDTFTVEVSFTNSDTATATITVTDDVGNEDTQFAVFDAVAEPTPTTFTATFSTATFSDGVLTATATVEDDPASPTATPPTTTQSQAILDGAAPELGPVTIAPDPIGPGQDVSVSGTVTDASTATVTVTLTDGTTTLTDEIVVAPGGDGAFEAVFPAAEVAGLDDGTLTATATATDATGRMAAPESDTATKDTADPAVTVVIEPDPIANDATTFTVSGTVSDSATVTVLVVVNDEDAETPQQTCERTVTADGDGTFTCEFNATTLSPGTITATATAVDAAGNNAAASDTATKSGPAEEPAPTDTTDPVVTGVTISPDPITAADQTVTVSGSVDEAATSTVRIDLTSSNGDATMTRTIELPAGGGDFSEEFDVSGLGDGIITATVTVIDASGNATAASDSATKDATLPVITGTVITPDPITESNQDAVTVTAEVDEASASTVTITLTSSGGAGSITRTVALPAAGGTISETFDVTSLPDGVITATVRVTDSAGNTATAQDTASKDTTPAQTGGGGAGTPANPPASTSPSASPTPSASASPTGSPATTPPSTVDCSVTPTVDVVDATIIATGGARIRVNAPANSTIEVLAYSRPSTTYRVVRRAEINASGDPASFLLVPPTNTRLFAQIVGCDTDEVRFSKVINVRTQLSLNVERLGTQTYRFFGSAIPARPNGLIVSLYRVTDSGRQVLTAQTRANANAGQAGFDPSRRAGSYSITRKFTGTGRFGFVVRTGQDLQNAPGSSNVRSLLIF